MQDTLPKNITFKAIDIFTASEDAVINPVNCKGAMGAGLAKVFKFRYPEMYGDWREMCLSGLVKIGTLSTWSADDRIIINLPTKIHWKDKSQIHFIKIGLRVLLQYLHGHPEIKSVAVPRLGCGLGGLQWEIVREIMIRAFSSCPEVEFIILSYD